MALESAEAIVLRRHPFGETSQVVRLLTREAGLVAALAKGARRPKGSFGGGLDLLLRGRAIVVHKRDRGLDLLREWEVREGFPGIRHDYRKIVLGLHLAEIALAGSGERQADPGLYDAVLDSLRALDGCPGETAGAVGLAATIALLDALGFAPALDACAACGGDVADAPRASLSAARGGLLCPRCGPNDPRRMEVVRGVPSVLRQAARLGPAGFGRVHVPDSILRSAVSAVEAFAGYHLDRTLRTLQFLPLARSAAPTPSPREPGRTH